MARPHSTRHPVVRDALPEDAAAVVALWSELLSVAGSIGRTSEPPSEAAVRARLQAVAADPTRRLLVAVEDGVVVGGVHLLAEPLTPLQDDVAVRVSYLHVAEGARRRGVGHALLAASLAWAERLDAAHVVADCHPAARDTNRFLARLGFGQMVVQRSVPVPALRRRLGSSGASEEVAVRRASLRVRAQGRVAAVARGAAPRARREHSVVGPG